MGSGDIPCIYDHRFSRMRRRAETIRSSILARELILKKDEDENAQSTKCLTTSHRKTVVCTRESLNLSCQTFEGHIIHTALARKKSTT